MINLKQTNKKKSFFFYFKQMLLFAVCAFFFGMGVHAESSVEIPETYKVTLPQKVEGVKKLEYMMDQRNMGSTSGIANAKVAPQSVLNFLVQVEPEGYDQLRAKDIKIKSQAGQTLNLMKYMYDKNGKFTKVLIPENELIDPKQTYVTSDYRVYHNDSLSLNELKKDAFSVRVSMDTSDYSISEALNISYKLGTSSETLSPVYNEKENCLEMNNVAVNTPITLIINKNDAFSQSKIEVFSGENQINLFKDGSVTIPAIKSDINVVIKNVHKNKYNISFRNHEGVSFEYRKQGEKDFRPSQGEVLDATYGEGYNFKCVFTDKNALENKELTANGVAIIKENDMYSLSNIQEDKVVDITQREEASYKINLPDKKSGAIITNESDEEMDFAKAKYGESFKFKLKANDGYTQHIGNAIVYAIPNDKFENNDYNTEQNSEEAEQYLLTPSNDGVFTIPEIKKSTSIVIKNLTKNIYRLNFPEKLDGVSYQVEASEGVEELSQNVFTAIHGSKVFVTLTTPEEKHLRDLALSCSSADALITNKGNKYSIENITEDTDVIIPRAEDKKCSVTFDNPGVIFKDAKGSALSGNSLIVDYNGSAEFKIGLAQGYAADNGIELSANSSYASITKLDENDSYKISNITDDIKISVQGPQRKKMTVRLGSDGTEKLAFKSADGKNISGSTQIEFGSDLEFEVSSPDKPNQMYTITSNDYETHIEALNSSYNKFAIRRVTSNTNLFATPVYASYKGNAMDLEEVEDNGEEENKKNNQSGNTAYALEDTNSESGTRDGGEGPGGYNETEEGPTTTTALIPENKKLTCFVNDKEVTWDNMLKDYHIFYTTDWGSENPTWLNMADNPNLKMEMEDENFRDKNTTSEPYYFDYKLKIKVVPKNGNRKCLTGMKMMIYGKTGGGMVGANYDMFKQSASNRVVGNVNVAGVRFPEKYTDPLSLSYWNWYVPATDDGNKIEILQNSSGNEGIASEKGWQGKFDLRVGLTKKSLSPEEKHPEQTILWDTGDPDKRDIQLKIYEDQYTYIQPFNKVQFYTPTANAADISKVRVEYIDNNDQNNNYSTEEENVSKPSQYLKLRNQDNTTMPKMRLVKKAGESSYTSDFEMKFTINSTDAKNLHFEENTDDDNSKMKKYILKEKNYKTTPFERFSQKFVAPLNDDGRPVYINSEGEEIPIDSDHTPNAEDKVFLTDQKYLDKYDDKYYKIENNGDETILSIKGGFTGTFDNYNPESPYITGGTDYYHATECYVDNICLSYDCTAPYYVNGNLTFTNSEGRASFYPPGSENPFSEAQTVPAEGDFTFRLKAEDSHYINFPDGADENVKSILENALQIERNPTNSQYNVDVLGYDRSYVDYKISKIRNNENKAGEVKLTIGFNSTLLQKKEFEGKFRGDNSTYTTADQEQLPITSQNIKYGDSFTFYAVPDNKGDVESIKHVKFVVAGETYYYDLTEEPFGNEQSIANKIKVKLEKIENKKLKVTLSDVRTDFTVSVGFNYKKLTITFHAEESYYYQCLSPQSLVDQGEIVRCDDPDSGKRNITYSNSFSFIVVNSEGTDISNITVTANGRKIEMVNGYYKVDSVTENQEIRVDGISVTQNTVTFTQYDDVFFKTLNNEPYSEQTPVNYDSEIKFKVTTSSAYSGSADDIKVFAEYSESGSKVEFKKDGGNTEYDENTHEYTLSHVTQAIRIYVEGMTPNKYTVTLKPMKGIDYYNEYGTHKFTSSEYTQSVTHGENFSFKVMAQTGYDISNLKIYDKPDSSSNSTQLLASNGVYTISNITEGHTVSAQNAPKSKCKIEFRTLTGANFTDSSGNTIENAIEVDYGSGYTFRLSLDSAYNKSQPIVNVKGTQKPLQKAANGSYTISNVTEDKIIEVSNVTKNTYTATFVDTEGVIYKTAKNKPFTGTQPVEYEGTLYFKISLMDAYDKSTPLVLLDDKKVLGENSGVYSISNIQDDVVVTVKNVVKNPEEISISENLTVPQEINTDGDVDAVVKATQTYMGLSDEEKEQVTNIDDLKKAQENAGRINHSSGDVEIAGVDWHIKLIVTSLTNDTEQMKSFEEKVDRRSLFSLYEIHLLDLLSGKDYEVPYGQKVSVILPAPNLAGCTNPVVAHETSAGSMEYLDLSIVDNRAQFETSSFSKFGIAAKKLENYVENPSNMKISVGSLIDNEDELKSLLGEGLVSQLGNLLDEDGKEQGKKEIGTPTDDSATNEDSLMDILGLKKVFNDAGMEDSYNWILEHELIIVSSILVVGGLLIWWLLAMARKKKKEDEEKINKK